VAVAAGQSLCLAPWSASTRAPAAPTLALVAAVALHEAVAPYAGARRSNGPTTSLVNGAKLAGILLERQGDAVMIGFGVNLAHHPEDLDRPQPAWRAGSRPRPCSPARRRFETWLDRWRARAGAGPRRLARRRPSGRHPLASGEREGTFDGLDETGALRLRLADGASRSYMPATFFLI
jgi:BirA family biotin operon repressor/biotin-[acetyl-CoA-carboxylase] ligase